MKSKLKSKLLGLCLLPSVLSLSAFAQGSSINVFTYQGRLSDANGPVTGLFDFSFSLYDSSFSTTQIGTTVMRQFHGVTNGLFVIPLDFPGSVGLFAGPDRWLEIAVRPAAAATNFVILSPRQQLTAAPYALRAATANSAIMAEVVMGSVGAGQIVGTLSPEQLPAGVLTNGTSNVNLAGSFSGDGAGLSNVPLDKLNSFGVLAWPGTFTLAPSPGVGDSPDAITTADVNGDAQLDLISANYSASTLSVLTNNGRGQFALAASPGVGSNPYSVAAADINGDGKVDLISANLSANTLSVLTNNGAGQFLLASSPGVGSQPYSVTAADVNGDGKLDLISANSGPSTLSVLTNKGSGGFTLAATLAVGNLPRSVTAADVNGDGKADLISANEGANTLSILTNNGTGNFSLAGSPGVGTGAYAVTAADVNGDGKTDLISANWIADTLSVLTNQGNGTFSLAASPGAGDAPFTLTTADVNNDGRMDLISASSSTRTLSVLLNNGNANFTLAFSARTGLQPNSVTAADLNGDQKPDLITANYGDNTLSILLNAPTFNAGFLSSSDNLVTNGVTGVMVKQGDNFLRTASAQAVAVFAANACGNVNPGPSCASPESLGQIPWGSVVSRSGALPAGGSAERWFSVSWSNAGGYHPRALLNAGAAYYTLDVFKACTGDYLMLGLPTFDTTSQTTLPAGTQVFVRVRPFTANPNCPTFTVSFINN